jgi:hypothetical protein
VKAVADAVDVDSEARGKCDISIVAHISIGLLYVEGISSMYLNVANPVVYSPFTPESIVSSVLMDSMTFPARSSKRHVGIKCDHIPALSVYGIEFDLLAYNVM